jgi:hypothetical protein
MLKPLPNVAVPALAFLMMALVGLQLTAGDFPPVARRPLAVAVTAPGRLAFAVFVAVLAFRGTRAPAPLASYRTVQP